MLEGFTEIVKRFFLIESIYIKTTIASFVLVVLINSGLLLFIPGLQSLQYPTIALIFTILSYLATAMGSLWAVEYENGKIKDIHKWYTVSSFAGFICSVAITIYTISRFLIEGKTWHIAAFILSQILNVSVVAGIFLALGLAIYFFKSRAKKHLGD